MEAGTLGLARPYEFGRAWQETVPVSNPAAGAGAVFQVPGEYSCRLIACVFRLATSAAAASRIVTVDYAAPDGLPYARAGAAVALLANSTQDFAGQAGRGTSEWAAGTPVFFPLPDIFVRPAHRIQLNVAAIDVADQLSRIQFVIEHFPTGPRGLPEGRVDLG